MPLAPAAFLFDLGGVVIEIDFDLAIQHWANASRTNWQELKPRFSQDVAYEKHEVGAISSESYLEAVQESLGVSIPTDEMLTGWNAIFKGPISGIHSALDRAKNFGPVHAFSNTNAAHFSYLEPRYGSELSKFGTLHLSHILRQRKPDPAAFQTVAMDMGFRPEQILFFDDSPVNVEGARAAGMQAVLVRSIDDVTKALDQACS